MESTTTDQQFFGAEASLSEPHFDEEATVLSARPVVPLTTIRGTKGVNPVNARTSFPRPWSLGLALVGTLLIGILATAIYYSRLNRNDSQLVDDTEVTAGGDASPTRSEGFSGPAVVQPAVNADTPAEVRRQASVKNQPLKASGVGSRKPVARRVAVITEKENRSEAVEGSREDRKAARRQARQERRRAEREKRGSRSSDDLLRIRDIFEGSPRP